MFREQSKIEKMVAAARDGDLGAVLGWLEKGVPIDGETRKTACSAVYAAVIGDHNEIAEYLVGQGAKVPNYAVAWAARHKNIDFLEFLAAREISLLGGLEGIVDSGDPRILELALGQGADAKEMLEIAAANGQEKSVCFLMDKKTEVTERAVRQARKNGNPAIAELLGLMHDPVEMKAWEKIKADGAVAEKAWLKVKEMEEAAAEICAPADAGKQARLEKLFTAVGELEKGLDMLRQSPLVDFDFSVWTSKENAVIKTNIQGNLAPLRLEISADYPDTVRLYTGDDKGYNLRVHENDRACYRGVNLVVKEFNDVSAAVDDVIERAFAKNAVRQPKCAAQKKPRGNAL